jgi:hypothetical protein
LFLVLGQGISCGQMVCPTWVLRALLREKFRLNRDKLWSGMMMSRLIQSHIEA